jgi:hypothetical protein
MVSARVQGTGPKQPISETSPAEDSPQKKPGDQETKNWTRNSQDKSGGMAGLRKGINQGRETKYVANEPKM